MNLHGLVNGLLAAIPVVSAGTAVTALWISFSTSRSAAREAKAHAEREARAIAYAVLSSIADVAISSRQMQIGLKTFREQQSHLFGQGLPALVGGQNVEMPPLLERHIDRLGGLPEEATRECLLLVNMLIASSRQTRQTANSIGIKGPREWGDNIDLRIATLKQMAMQADRAIATLLKVIEHSPDADGSGDTKKEWWMLPAKTETEDPS